MTFAYIKGGDAEASQTAIISEEEKPVDCFLFSLVKLEGSENKKPVSTDFFHLSPHLN